MNAINYILRTYHLSIYKIQYYAFLIQEHLKYSLTQNVFKLFVIRGCLKAERLLSEVSLVCYQDLIGIVSIYYMS